MDRDPRQACENGHRPGTRSRTFFAPAGYSCGHYGPVEVAAQAVAVLSTAAVCDVAVRRALFGMQQWMAKLNSALSHSIPEHWRLEL